MDLKNKIILVLSVISIVLILVIGYNVFFKSKFNNNYNLDDLNLNSKNIVDNDSFNSTAADSNYNVEIEPHTSDNIISKANVPEIISKKIVFSPEEYASIKNCTPFLGDNNSPLKILFVNLNDAYQFTEIRSDIIDNQFKKISPFKENLNKTAFYSINIENADENSICSNYDIGFNGGVVCDNSKIYEEINKFCEIDDVRGLITIVILNSNRGGSGGDIIYIGTDKEREPEVNFALKKNVAIHEVGHNFGLADLYFGALYFDGRPSKFWDVNYSRAFLNVDGPGCAKWCNSYKPVSEYTESLTSKCLTFTEKQDCVSFNRYLEGFCNYEGTDAACCVWSDEKFEYFNTNCVPVIGTENIGIDCLEGSGCYFGAVYGNYAWRPVNSRGFSESIMYGLSTDSFDSVSERELSKVFKCCLSEESSGLDCVDFRKTYSDFLENINFKKRIGSCGYKK